MKRVTALFVTTVMLATTMVVLPDLGTPVLAHPPNPGSHPHDPDYRNSHPPVTFNAGNDCPGRTAEDCSHRRRAKPTLKVRTPRRRRCCACTRNCTATRGGSKRGCRASVTAPPPV